MVEGKPNKIGGRIPGLWSRHFTAWASVFPLLQGLGVSLASVVQVYTVMISAISIKYFTQHLALPKFTICEVTC